MNKDTFIWKPSLGTALLDERMDNAMRRVSGSVGLDISFDKGRMRALKDTAADVLNAGLSSPGPLFMRIGKGAFEAGFCKIGESLNLEEVGAEILHEFYTEASAAYQAAKVTLYAEALEIMHAKGMDEAHCQAVLEAADVVFAVPSKDVFTKIGFPFVKTMAAPVTQAVLGGLGGFILTFMLSRIPHLGFFSGVLIGGVAYYLARTRIRRRSEELLHVLPRNLYEMLATHWNSSIRRYAETINAGIPS